MGCYKKMEGVICYIGLCIDDTILISDKNTYNKWYNK
jgi:hypothetical protein